MPMTWKTCAHPEVNVRTLADATPSSDGVMSRVDKAKLDTLAPVPSIIGKNADFSASVGNHYRVDTTGGDVTATLDAPSLSNAGSDVTFKKIVGAHSMIVASSALVDGAATVTVAGGVTGAFQSITVRSTGTTWDII